MAFEYIYKMVDELEKEYQSEKEKAEKNYGVDPPRARMHANIASGIFRSLILYYETVLQTGKFKDQRMHGRKAIERINPAFAEGYFKGKK